MFCKRISTQASPVVKFLTCKLQIAKEAKNDIETYLSMGKDRCPVPIVVAETQACKLQQDQQEKKNKRNMQTRNQWTILICNLCMWLLHQRSRTVMLSSSCSWSPMFNKEPTSIVAIVTHGKRKSYFLPTYKDVLQEYFDSGIPSSEISHLQTANRKWI